MQQYQWLGFKIIFQKYCAMVLSWGVTKPTTICNLWSIQHKKKIYILFYHDYITMLKDIFNI